MRFSSLSSSSHFTVSAPFSPTISRRHFVPFILCALFSLALWSPSISSALQNVTNVTCSIRGKDYTADYTFTRNHNNVSDGVEYNITSNIRYNETYSRSGSFFNLSADLLSCFESQEFLMGERCYIAPFELRYGNGTAVGREYDPLMNITANRELAVYLFGVESRPIEKDEDVEWAPDMPAVRRGMIYEVKEANGCLRLVDDCHSLSATTNSATVSSTDTPLNSSFLSPEPEDQSVWEPAVILGVLAVILTVHVTLFVIGILYYFECIKPN